MVLIYTRRFLFLCFNLLPCAWTIVSCTSSEPGFLREPNPDTIAAVGARAVIVHYNIGTDPKGTGVLIDDKGLVLTCFHVVSGWQDRVRVSSDGQTTYEARLVYSEPKLDLVLYQTPIRAAVTDLQWVNREDLHVNEPVFAVGAAWGLPASFLKGYIVHTDRTGADVTYPKIPFIQTMGASFPGLSGAGVYLNNGRIIGINRATIGMEAGNSTGLVIPAGYVRTFLNEALSHIQK